mgnify:CR=1 FL=1
MQQQPGSNFNPYAPPTADVDQGLQLQHGDYVLADRGTRLGAALIDGLLSVAAALPAGLILGFTVYNNTRGNMGVGDLEVMTIGLIALMVLMVLELHPIILMLLSGQVLLKNGLEQ